MNEACPPRTSSRGSMRRPCRRRRFSTAIEVPAARPRRALRFYRTRPPQRRLCSVGLAAKAVMQNGAFSDLRLAYFAVGAKPTLAAKRGGARSRTTGHRCRRWSRRRRPSPTISRRRTTCTLPAATRLHLRACCLRRVPVEELSPEAHVGKEARVTPRSGYPSRSTARRSRRACRRARISPTSSATSSV